MFTNFRAQPHSSCLHSARLGRRVDASEAMLNLAPKPNSNKLSRVDIPAPWWVGKISLTYLWGIRRDISTNSCIRKLLSLLYLLSFTTPT